MVYNFNPLCSRDLTKPNYVYSPIPRVSKCCCCDDLVLDTKGSVKEEVNQVKPEKNEHESWIDLDY